MDSTWKKKQRASKGDMVEVSGERDERSVMDWGIVQQMSADRQKRAAMVKALCA